MTRIGYHASHERSSFAPCHLLLVDPHLPEWLPALTVHHLSATRPYRCVSTGGGCKVELPGDGAAR